jgi:ligand-binding SRPBCC domain-containing protein
MYQLKREQLVKTDLQTCWDFFSSPKNLSVITPEKMKFTVLAEQPKTMYEGLMITYKVSPVLGIPLGWITEIKTVQDGVFFVDEQRKGPYKIWHHEHRFEAVEGGVLMTDIVSYTLPFGFLGKLAHWLFVRKELEAIFEYRFKKVDELFH